MTDLNPLDILRAENAQLRNTVKEADKALKELLSRCKSQDGAIEELTELIATILHKHGGEIVLSKVDFEDAQAKVMPGFRREQREDDRVAVKTFTQEEFEDMKRRREAVDEAQRQGGVKPRIIKP